MELSKCVRCNKLYNRVRISVCPTCETEEEKDIFAVSRHLKDHPNTSLYEVSDALNIYIEDIFRWIDEKRLEVSIHHREATNCESCGAPVASGRLCPECRKILLNNPLEGLKVHLTNAGAGAPTASTSFRNRVDAGSSIRKYRRV
jgi:hypothetical protein